MNNHPSASLSAVRGPQPNVPYRIRGATFSVTFAHPAI